MKRKIDYIVIHCTATPQNTTVESIKNYWRSVLLWKNPGYHFLISQDGSVHHLQPMDLPTNGVKGYNQNSIHISYIGGQFTDDRTPAQKASIIECIRIAQNFAGNHIPVIQGHRDFPGVKKACPQFDAKAEYQNLRGQ